MFNDIIIISLIRSYKDIINMIVEYTFFFAHHMNEIGQIVFLKKKIGVAWSMST